MKIFMALFISLFYFQISSAQLTKVLHQTFDIGEAETVSLGITGEYKIEKWAGNTIMTETSIELYDATPNILKYFVKAGRYEIEGEENNTSYKLASKNAERKAIRTKQGECYEFVKIRVFVPEDFDIVNDNSLVRMSPDEENVVKDN